MSCLPCLVRTQTHAHTYTDTHTHTSPCVPATPPADRVCVHLQLHLRCPRQSAAERGHWAETAAARQTLCDVQTVTWRHSATRPACQARSLCGLGWAVCEDSCCVTRSRSAMLTRVLLAGSRPPPRHGLREPTPLRSDRRTPPLPTASRPPRSPPRACLVRRPLQCGTSATG